MKVFNQIKSTMSKLRFHQLEKPNSQRIFAHRGSGRLMTDYALYQSCKVPMLAQNGNRLYERANKIVGRPITHFMTEQTLGKVFTAGKTFEQLFVELKMYKESNINVISDYAIEGLEGHDEISLEEKKLDFEKTILASAATDKKNVVAMKMTGLAALGTLRKYSLAQRYLQELFSDIVGLDVDVFLTRQQMVEHLENNNIQFTSEEVDDFFRIGKLDSKDQDINILTATEYYRNIHAYHMDPKYTCALINRICHFEQKTKTNIESLKTRLLYVADKCKENGIVMMADAEQLNLQYAIDSLCRQLQTIYNQERVIVANTFQCYLKSTMRIVELNLKNNNIVGLPFAAKLVRGAYMTEERETAQKTGRPDPICDTEEITHKNYDKAIELIMRNMSPGSYLNVSTHNHDSVNLTKQLLNDPTLDFSQSTINFAQLKGMEDKLTFEMAEEGYDSYKYLAFGPTQYLAPYLLRRAEEASTYIGKGVNQQQAAIIQELKYRRIHLWTLAFLTGLIAARPTYRYLKNIYQRDKGTKSK